MPGHSLHRPQLRGLPGPAPRPAVAGNTSHTQTGWKLRDSHMGRVWVPGPAREVPATGAALVGLGKQAQLMNPSELTPSPSPLSFWVSQLLHRKLLFVNSVATDNQIQENSLFKVESEGDTWRNGSGGDNRRAWLPSRPPLLSLLEQGLDPQRRPLLAIPRACGSAPLSLPEREARWPPTHTGSQTHIRTSVPRHAQQLRFSHISHECLLSPPAQPPSQSWWSNWGQRAKYRLDPEGSQPDNYTACPGPPQSTPVQEGTLGKAGSRLGGDRQGCIEHNAQHFYKEKG